MQNKNKKVATYSPLRSRGEGGQGSQQLAPEYPVLFKNSSIDGSKDALKEKNIGQYSHW